MVQKIGERVAQWIGRTSEKIDWTLKEIGKLGLQINKLTLVGSQNISLPKWMKDKKSVINVQIDIQQVLIEGEGKT